MNLSPVDLHSIDSVTTLTRDVKAFIKARATATSGDLFDALALRAVRLQATALPGYLRLFETRGIDVLDLHHWQDAPPIPTGAFQKRRLTLLPTERVFRSSGTLAGQHNRSEHHHGNLQLYRLIVEATFPPAVLNQPSSAPLDKVPILSLIPPIPLVPDSSLSFMTQEVMNNYGNQDSTYAFSDGRLDFPKALGWLQQQDRNRPLIMTTAVALWELLTAQRDSGTESCWPSTTTIMETGGFKTLRFEVSRNQLLHRLTALTGVPATQVVREYGMTELTSQAYSLVLQGGDPDRFSLPTWVRARALDPVTMQDVAPGTVGLLSFLDLGNIGSVASLLTADLGTVEAGGRNFKLHGRAADAQLRGCSLTTESFFP